MKRFLATILITALAAALLFSSAWADEPKPGGKLIFAMPADLRQLDPHLMATTAEGRYFRLICEPLIDSDDNFQPAACLAESWQISEDGLQWTIQLKKGVKFHNGREMTAEDIKWNFDRILDPKNRTPSAGRLQAVKAVSVTGPHTVRFDLKRRSAGFLANFFGAGGFVAMIAPESIGSDGKVSHPIGTGPFKFVEWKPNEHVKYTKFDAYREKGLPYLDEVTIKPVPDNTVRLAALRSGEVDMTYKLNIDEVVKLKEGGIKGLVFDLSVPDWPLFVFFNSSKPPFNDPRVRQAVALAMDKEDILVAVFEGYGEVVNQVFQKKSPWYCDVPEVKPDLDKARKLLAEAGYDNSLEVELATSNTYPNILAMAQVIQMQLAEVGVKVKLIVEDWPAHIKRDISGNFHMGTAGWSVTSDPETFYPMVFVDKGPLRWLRPGYDNPELVKLIGQGAMASSPDERKQAYTRAAEIMVQEAPWIFNVIGPNVYGWKNSVKGFKPVIGHQIYVGGGFQYTWLDR